MFVRERKNMVGFLKEKERKRENEKNEKFVLEKREKKIDFFF